MSGGVDSAVALLQAGPGRSGHAPALARPGRARPERACCSPEAVIAARETCHALGLPHVTLDLREEFRRAVVDPFVAAYARGETPNPCGRCNGDFRFDELLAFADRAGAARLWTGHYARIVERQGPAARPRRRPRQGSVVHARAARPGLLDRIEFPLGEQTKAETRAEAGAAKLDVAERRESQEAASWPATTTARSSSAAGSSRPTERSWTRPERARTARRRLALHPGTAPRDRRRRAGAALRLRSDPSTNTLVVGPRGSLACTSVSCGALHAGQVEGELRYRSAARLPGCTATGGLRARARAAGVRRRARSDRGALRRRGRVVGCGVVSSAGRN